jgi:hypothetical protein
MRGQPFELGNKLGKGRPPGSRNKKSIFQEAFELHGKEIIDNIKLQALKSNPTAMKICAERLAPICKAPNSQFRIHRLRSAADMPKVISEVLREVAAGKLSAQEGESVGRLVGGYGSALETSEFGERMETMEQKNSETEDKRV